MCCLGGRLAMPSARVCACWRASVSSTERGLSSWQQAWAERAAQGRRRRRGLRQRGGHGRRAAKGVAEAAAVQRLHARRRRRRVARAALALARGGTRVKARLRHTRTPSLQATPRREPHVEQTPGPVLVTALQARLCQAEPSTTISCGGQACHMYARPECITAFQAQAP